MTTPKAKSKSAGIHQKIHAMMKQLEYIQKDKRNDHFGYNYLSEAAIKQAIHPLLVEHGVVFLMKTTNVRETGTLTSADFEASFTDIDSGESIVIPCHGQGQDNSDKGYPKSVTNAIKYLMTSTFLIPTGDDPEKSNGQPQTTDTKPDVRYEQPPPEVTLPADGPRCPKCDNFMRLVPARAADSGKKPHGAFWSCGKYPDCKGTVDAAVFEQEQEEMSGQEDLEGLTAEDVFK